MSEYIMELLKSVEKMSTEDLKRLSTWIEFNIQKRKHDEKESV